MKNSTNTLENLMESAGLKLAELSKKTKIPLSTLGAMKKGTRPLKKHRAVLEEFFGVEIEENSTNDPSKFEESAVANNPRSVMDRMPKEFHDKIEAQWQAQSRDHLKGLLENRVEREDWGAVQLIAGKLLDRDLTEFNEKLMNGEKP